MTHAANEPASSAVIGDIVEEHFEELDFLLELREGVVAAPDWDLEELAELEARAEAHLDGLRVADAYAIELARPFLNEGDATARRAATVLFMDRGDEDLAQEVLDAFDAADSHEARDGIRLGLRYAGLGILRDALAERAQGEDASASVCAADALAFHRDAGRVEASAWIAAEDPAVRALAWSVLGRRREAGSLDLARRALADEAASVRLAGLRACAMSGCSDLARLCRETIDSAGPGDAATRTALSFLGVIGVEGDLERFLEALGKPELATAACSAIGALGRTRAIPSLITAMSSEDAATALAAGAAFNRIVGPVDIESDLPDTPEDERGDEEDLEVDFDDEFDEAPLLPDPEKARAWWSANGAAHHEGLRLQCGVEASNPMDVLASVSLESRRDLYLRQCVEFGTDTPDIELEARVLS